MNEAHAEVLAEAVVFAHDPSLAAATATAELAPFERAAALAAAAFASPLAVPPALQARLAAAGLAFCAAQRRLRPLPSPAPAATARRRRPLATPAAFAAGLAAGLALWFAVGNRPGQSPPLAPSRLLAEDPAAVTLAWKPGPSPNSGTVVGEVVWSQQLQQGVLVFRGLPPCDENHRFQLWIVDGTREGAPVDGGLFGIADAGRETVIPVRAALPIGKPAAFVVTLEKKAGAVVSKQEHVVAVAGL